MRYLFSPSSLPMRPRARLNLTPNLNSLTQKAHKQRLGTRLQGLGNLFCQSAWKTMETVD